MATKRIAGLPVRLLLCSDDIRIRHNHDLLLNSSSSYTRRTVVLPGQIYSRWTQPYNCAWEGDGKQRIDDQQCVWVCFGMCAVLLNLNDRIFR